MDSHQSLVVVAPLLLSSDLKNREKGLAKIKSSPFAELINSEVQKNIFEAFVVSNTPEEALNILKDSNHLPTIVAENLLSWTHKARNAAILKKRCYLCDQPMMGNHRGSPQCRICKVTG